MPHHIDIHVGKRLRQRRWVLDATQKQIAEEIGIRYQQLQKYETGVNRMSVSRLWDLAAALRVPVSYFFDGIPENGQPHPEVESRESGRNGADGGTTIGQKEAAEMVRAFSAIPELERQRLLGLAEALSTVQRPKTTLNGKSGE